MCSCINPAERPHARDAAEILRVRRIERITCGCPGWAVFEVNKLHGIEIEIEACDECNSIARDRGFETLVDEDLDALPHVRRALADACLTDNGRKPMPRLRGRALARAREQALREYDLRLALSLAHEWTVYPDRERALTRIREIASAALDAE